MCGYVYSRRDGKYVYYGISDPRVKRVLQALARENIADSPKDNEMKASPSGKEQYYQQSECGRSGKEDGELE